MTTKTKGAAAPPAEKPETVAAAPKLVFEGLVKLSEIREEHNVRKDYDEAALKELASNIRAYGVLQPPIVRKNGGKGLILIAGHRRYRAAKMAGLPEIPVRCLDVDEAGAAEIQALENLHRAGRRNARSSTGRP